MITHMTSRSAARSVLVATSPQLEGIGGRYFQDCNEAPIVPAAAAGAGVAAYALDAASGQRLWELSRGTRGNERFV
jgi:hypothetical protein